MSNGYNPTPRDEPQAPKWMPPLSQPTWSDGDWGPPTDDAFTAEQMRAFAADAAERCAKLCEDSNVFEYDDPGGFFARLIRGSTAAPEKGKP